MTSDSPTARKPAFGTQKRKVVTALLAAFALVTAVPAQAFLARPVLFSAVGPVIKPPASWLQFCTEHPADCRPNVDASREVVLTPDLLRQLYSINSFSNTRVKWTSDADLYHKPEHWALPLDRGDCEDIVLLKRRLLAHAGWPVGALLVTVVEEPNERHERHAVLTVRTDRGELILDNQTPEILFWYETNYRYQMRQSTADPNVWVSFLDEQPRPSPAPAAH